MSPSDRANWGGGRAELPWKSFYSVGRSLTKNNSNEITYLPLGNMK